jgi:transcriptional regulator with XRE-family HTH domain
MDTNTVAKAVKKANRSAVARQTGISLSGVSRILSGDRAASARNLATIAIKLGVSMADLYAHLTRLQRRRSRRRQSVAA